MIAAPGSTPAPGNAPPQTDATVRLDQLPAGQWALVTAIDTASRDAERLKIMGLCLGRRVQVVKAGDPLIVRVMDTHIGLATRLAEWVAVRPLPTLSETPATPG